MTVRNVFVSTEPGVQAGLSGTFFIVRRVAGFALMFSACASPPRSTAPPPVVAAAPPVVAPPPAPAPPARWSIAAPSSGASFVLESRASFSARADTLVRTDSSVTRAALRVVPRGAAVDVTIAAFAITSSYSQPLALTAPSRSVGRFDASGAIAFEGPGESSCTSLTSIAFESTRDLWVKWPADVAIGTQWHDSTTTTACRDGIPLRVSFVRNYRVISASPDTLAPLLDIERTSRVNVSGQGVLRGDTITLSGEGTGTARMRVAAATGWLFDAAGTSVLQVRAVSRTRTQTVDQRVEFTVRQDSTVSR